MEVWHGLDDRLAQLASKEISQADRDYMTTATIEECGVYFHEKFGVGTSPHDVVDLIDREMLDFYEHKARPKPGALAFVQALADRNVPMAVVSSTPTRLLQTGIKACGFEPYMKAIYSVDDFNTSKRDPFIFDQARAHLGTPRETTWAFDDAVYALTTLHNAGYHTVGIYDSDIAGTPSQLKKVATSFIMSFDDIDAKEFLALVRSAASA